MQIYLNGEFVDSQHAKISVMDRGFLFADGVYEVVPCYGGKMFRREEHLTRLANSLDAIGIPNPHTLEAWNAILQQLIDQQDTGELSIYLQVTRGAYETRDHRIPAEQKPTVFAMAKPIRDNSELLSGIACVTLDDIRWNYCLIKSIALLPNVLLNQQALEKDANEAILIRDGLVTEGASSNVFMVKDGEIHTPTKSDHILPGVTRDLVVELAHQHGMECIERDITPEELAQADELWITSSTREVVPVITLNNQAIGDGKPGPLWAQMIQHYREYKEQFRHER